MAFSVDKFRQLFSEFANDQKYSDVLIELYHDMASSFISGPDSPQFILSGSKRENALYLLTAHVMALGIATSTSTASGAPSAGGNVGGMVTSATVGEVSVAKLAPPASNGWQWWLAGTPYGQQLWALLSLLAVGGFSVGGLPEREGFRKIGGVFW